ncbi:MAG TPA: SHOCT domain-containing protein [Solirubrobacterales bacterium]|nr:SHOCT domain-containing protein [Solirubrobacterales bacterium]
MSTWITLSVIALVPMLLRAPKALSPLRVKAEDPSRFAGLFRRYAIHSFTGYASDVGKRSDSYTRGSIDGGGGVETGVSVSGSIDTEVVVTDRFFLTNAEGKSMSFEGTGFEALVGNGHVVSLVWVIRGRKRSGSFFLIFDQTTGETFFNEKKISKAITFPYPSAYLGLLCLMLLPLPVVAFFWLAEAWQVGRLKRAGVRPLLAALQADAAGLPPEPEPAAVTVSAGAGDIASGLKELAALRESGSLSELEFEAAKARLLGA